MQKSCHQGRSREASCGIHNQGLEILSSHLHIQRLLGSTIAQEVKNWLLPEAAQVSLSPLSCGYGVDKVTM